MPSLLEALEQKYGDRGAVDPAASSQEAGISVAIFVPCKSPRAVVPALLVLNDCNIATAGEKEALVEKCSNVEELDLANNKLNHWDEVFSILQQMPRLKFVNLSFNILSKPLESNLDRETKWERLRSLVLNSTYINWDSVQEILDHVPCLEELHLSLNDYNDVELHKKCLKCTENENRTSTKNDNNSNDNQNCTENENIICTESEKCTESQGCTDDKTENVDKCDKDNENKNCCQCDIDNKCKLKHPVVKILHFVGNPVENWRKIKKLGYAFPNLESLVLAECPIKSIDIAAKTEDDSLNNTANKAETESDKNENDETPHDAFGALKILNLNSTMINSWNDIEKLSKFPNLHSVRLQGCPLWESNEYTEHERRQLLIARLPNVQTLNGGGIISAEEREDAERAFIRYYMDKPESDRPERYFELVQTHGKLDPLVNVDLRPEKRVKVTFTCGSNSEVRSVDVYRTISDLKSKLEGFAGFSAAKMRLFYVDQDLRDIQGPEEMKFPHKQLYSYNIRSGDEIIIDCKRRTVSETKMSMEEEKKMYNL